MVQANPRLMADVQAHPVAFLQRRWVQNGLPVLTSLAFHAGLIVFAYSVYRVATIVVCHPVIASPIDNVEYAPPPKTVVNGTGPEGATVGNRLGNSDLPEIDSDVFKPTEPKVMGQAMSTLGADDSPEATMIGPGSRSGPSDNGITNCFPGVVGPVPNHNWGRPDGDPKVGGTGFPTKVLSPRVIFVCDATGSMQSIFGGLKAELQKSIDHLELPQAFNVIFFSDDKVLSPNPQGLMLASDANKRKSFEFLSDISPHGQTNPLPAIRAAFAQKPELIYVLTDGFDQVDSLESVYNEFATLNKDGKTRVNTILIGTPDQKELVDILKRIAKDNRGTMQVVSRDAF